MVVAEVEEPQAKIALQRPVIARNPAMLGGTPTLGGTRLPLVALIDYYLDGHTIDEFVEDFGADRTVAEAALLKIREALEEGWLAEDWE